MDHFNCKNGTVRYTGAFVVMVILWTSLTGSACGEEFRYSPGSFFSLLSEGRFEEILAIQIPDTIPNGIAGAMLCLKAAAARGAGKSLMVTKTMLDSASVLCPLPDSTVTRCFMAGEIRTGLGYSAMKMGELDSALNYFREGWRTGSHEALLGEMAACMLGGVSVVSDRERNVWIESGSENGGTGEMVFALARAMVAGGGPEDWSRFFRAFPDDTSRIRPAFQGDVLFLGSPDDWIEWIAVADSVSAHSPDAWFEPDGGEVRRLGEDAATGALLAGRPVIAERICNELALSGRPLDWNIAAGTCIATGDRRTALNILHRKLLEQYTDIGNEKNEILLEAWLLQELHFEKHPLIADFLAGRENIQTGQYVSALLGGLLLESKPQIAERLLLKAAGTPISTPGAASEAYKYLLKKTDPDTRRQLPVKAFNLFPFTDHFAETCAVNAAEARDRSLVTKAVNTALDVRNHSVEESALLAESCVKVGLTEKAARIFSEMDFDSVVRYGGTEVLESWFLEQGGLEEADSLNDRYLYFNPEDWGALAAGARLKAELGNPGESAEFIAELLRWDRNTEKGAVCFFGIPVQDQNEVSLDSILSWLGDFVADGDTLDKDIVLETAEILFSKPDISQQVSWLILPVFAECGFLTDAAGLIETNFEKFIRKAESGNEGRLKMMSGVMRNVGEWDAAFTIDSVLLETGSADRTDTLHALTDAYLAGEDAWVLNFIDNLGLSQIRKNRKGNLPNGPDSTSAAVLYIEGMAALDLGFETRAIRSFADAMTLVPDEAACVTGFAKACIDSGVPFNGELALDEWVDRHPGVWDTELFLTLGRCSLLDANRLKARAMFDMVLTYEPCNKEAMISIRNMAEDVDDLNGTVEITGRMIACRPEEPEPYRRLASDFRERGFFDKAIDVMERMSVECQAYSALDMEFLGDLYNSAGLPDVAALRYMEAVRTEPRLLSCRLKLALVDVLIDKVDEAIRNLEEFMTLFPPGHPDFEAARAFRDELKKKRSGTE